MEPLIIFYADDDEDDHFIFKESLNNTHIPYTLKLFKNGLSLLGELEKVNFACDVVFTDLNMPVCDGLGVLKSLQQPILEDGLRVVVLSTSDAMSDIQKIYELNASLFIQKTNNIRIFVKLLKTVIQDKLYSRLPDNRESFIVTKKMFN